MTNLDLSLRIRAYFEDPPSRTLAAFWQSFRAPSVAYGKSFDCNRFHYPHDWGAVKAAGYNVALILATDGLWTDTKFTQNWQGANNAGMIILPWHIFRGNIDGVQQAVYHNQVIAPLLDATGGRVLGSGPDVETADGVSQATRRARLYDCCMKFNERRKPHVYSNKKYWGELIGTVTWISQFYQWPASWSPYAPTMPDGWSLDNVIFRQRGICGVHTWVPSSIPGITNPIDYDDVWVSDDELRAMVGDTTEPTLEERVTALETEARAHGWNV